MWDKTNRSKWTLPTFDRAGQQAFWDRQSASYSETIDTFVALGHPEYDARKAVQRIKENNLEIISPNEAAREALKRMST